MDVQLTDEKYWANSYVANEDVTCTSQFQWLFDRYLEPADDVERGTVIEIGACPGGNLAALCKSHNYHGFAIDLLPAVHRIKGLFQANGLAEPVTMQGDFTQHKLEQKFRVVMSWGFIEHFEDWHGIVRRHWDLVEPGGTCMIGMPILGPLQYSFYKFLVAPDYFKSILAAHNLEAMHLSRLHRYMRSLPGARVEFARHILGTLCWIENTEVPSKRRLILLKIWRRFSRLYPAQWSASRWISPYAVVIARKTGG